MSGRQRFAGELEAIKIAQILRWLMKTCQAVTETKRPELSLVEHFMGFRGTLLELATEASRFRAAERPRNLTNPPTEILFC
jgi:hypothetical protein